MEQSSIAVLTSAFACCGEGQLVSHLLYCELPYLFDGTNTDIKVCPGWFDLASPEEADDPDGVFVGAPPPDALLVVDFIFRFRHPLDDVPQPSDLFLHESNIGKHQQNFRVLLFQDSFQHQHYGRVSPEIKMTDARKGLTCRLLRVIFRLQLGHCRRDSSLQKEDPVLEDMPSATGT